jgi:hypothetical protein
MAHHRVTHYHEGDGIRLKQEVRPKRTQTVTAVFDGSVLRPDTPLDLEPDTRYILTIQQDSAASVEGDAWDVLERFAGTVDAPPDWASEHDHYLYGMVKHQSQG